ncbi:TPA: hypothetical protein I7256_22735 [Vibrio vulnificus]|nr:hypothetical protein [Vibrio vulnificus]
MDTNKRKRIKVKSLLDSGLKDVIQSAIDRQVLDLEGSLSPDWVAILKCSMIENGELESDQQLTLASIRKIANENNIVKNLSQTSATKIHAIIYDTKKVSRGPDHYVDVIDYAINTRISSTIVLDEPNNYDAESLFERIAAFNSIAVFPLLFMHAQANLSQKTALTLPSLSYRLHKVPLPIAEALIALLEDPENEFNTLDIQKIIQKKTGKIMSYKMIRDVQDMVCWIEESYSHYSDKLIERLEICNTNTLALLKTVINHIISSYRDVENAKATISTILKHYYRSIILEGKGGLEGEVMFD